VKIRGFRIELHEIESVLKSHPQVDAAVVITRESDNGEKELVAYIVSKDNLTSLDLKDFLAKTLPGYMIPDHFFQLEKLPFTFNGKLDRAALPDPETSRMESGLFYEPPGNDMEQKLVEIWQELLDRENIGIRDNFFDVGGNSMKIVRLSQLINQRLDKNVSVAILFQYSTIRDLNDYLSKEIVRYDENDFDRNDFIADLDKFNLE
jgi:acyl carrier protein